MATDINNFLVSFLAAIAEATSLSIAPPSQQLWVGDAIEDRSNQVYTSLRIYGGDEPPVFAGMRRRTVRVQADTRGVDQLAVMTQAWAVHESLIVDATGQSRVDWAIAGKRIKASDETQIENDPAGGWVVRSIDFIGGPPGLRGRDAQDRWMATGNIEVKFRRAA